MSFGAAVCCPYCGEPTGPRGQHLSMLSCMAALKLTRDRFMKERAALADRLVRLIRLPLQRPMIVCLCGSTRFVDEFNRQRKARTLAGEIVLSIEIVTTQAPDEDPQHVAPDVKRRLDELHLSKIDMADRVLVLNVGGYIGESTQREIEYAESIGKRVDYLESEI